MRFSVVLLSLMIAGPGAAEDLAAYGEPATTQFPFTYKGRTYFAARPAEEWLKVPLKHEPEIYRWPPDSTNGKCMSLMNGQRHPFGLPHFACSLPSPYDTLPCRVYINSEIISSDYEEILRHELAHCAGWGPEHP